MTQYQPIQISQTDYNKFLWYPLFFFKKKEKEKVQLGQA